MTKYDIYNFKRYSINIYVFKTVWQKWQKYDSSIIIQTNLLKTFNEDIFGDMDWDVTNERVDDFR